MSVIGNIEFRGKGTKTDYVPYLPMIKGTIRNEELWLAVLEINGRIIHEVRTTGMRL